MPPFDSDLTDPTPAAVEQAMVTAVETANQRCKVGLMPPDRAAYRAFVTSEFAAAEGVAIWLAEKGRVTEFPPTPRATLLGLAWRTSPLGRRTVRVVGRRVEPFKESLRNRFGPPWRAWPALCHLDPDHVVTRSLAGGPPVAIAICGCGAVGPPDKLGWMSGRCGPCHDHLEEHGTPLAAGNGPPALRCEGQLLRAGFLPSGEAVAGVEWVGAREELQVVVWGRRTGALLTASAAPPIVKAVAQTRFAAGLTLPGHYCAYWVAPTGRAVRLSGLTGGAMLAFLGTTAAALGYDGEAHRRDLTTAGGWERCWPSRRHVDELFAGLAFAPGGAKVALGRYGGAVELLDWPGGAVAAVLRPEPASEDHRPRALAFSPDGKLLAVGSSLSGFVDDPSEEWYGRGGAVHLYGVGKGECVLGVAAPNDDVMAVAFSPDGSLLFYGSTDCHVHVIDVGTRQEVAVLGGHVGGVNGLAFSPDGQTLASAGGDGLVRLWPWRQVLGLPAPHEEPAAKPAAKARKKR